MLESPTDKLREETGLLSMVLALWWRTHFCEALTSNGLRTSAVGQVTDKSAFQLSTCVARCLWLLHPCFVSFCLFLSLSLSVSFSRSLSLSFSFCAGTYTCSSTRTPLIASILSASLLPSLFLSLSPSHFQDADTSPDSCSSSMLHEGKTVLHGPNIQPANARQLLGDSLTSLKPMLFRNSESNVGHAQKPSLIAEMSARTQVGVLVCVCKGHSLEVANMLLGAHKQQPHEKDGFTTCGRGSCCRGLLVSLSLSPSLCLSFFPSFFCV